MYIEFRLPNGAAGQAAAHANHVINQALRSWSDRYNIPYWTKIHKYHKRVTFVDDASYLLFSLTWNPDQKLSVLSRWRIVSDLNNKSSFDSIV
jgi:hypothetical protein